MLESVTAPRRVFISVSTVPPQPVPATTSARGPGRTSRLRNFAIGLLQQCPFVFRSFLRTLHSFSSSNANQANPPQATEPSLSRTASISDPAPPYSRPPPYCNVEHVSHPVHVVPISAEADPDSGEA
ncbi:hypothetical protein FRB99_008643, partial [Tulasnella sp. 403]